MSRSIRCLSASLGLLAFLSIGCEKLTPQQEHFARGYKAYNRGDFSSALLYLKPLVEAGHPAAQLLLAKMYARGDGVPQDMGKAELLRNLAAYQIYKKKDLPPGVVRPANETLASISDRLDYFVEAGSGKAAPTHDLSQVLETMDVKGLTDLVNVEGAPGNASPEVAIEIPHESAESAKDQEGSTPKQAAGQADESAQKPAPTLSPVESNLHGSRRSESISLGIVRQAAADGDVRAMELLSAAYANGFYGLQPSTTQAMMWSVKVMEAKHRRHSFWEGDPMDQVPLGRLLSIIALGLVFIGAGVWRWSKLR